MKLYEKYFNNVKNNKKKVELRLYDDKRKDIKIGDTITFLKLPQLDETIKIVVIGISRFDSFKEIYSTFPPSFFNHPNNISVEEQVQKEREYYSEEREKEFGVVGFHIKLIKD